MLEVLVCDKFFQVTFASLEWDPDSMAQPEDENEEYPTVLHKTLNYREFLTDEVKFKKVVDFSGVTSYAYPSSADSEAIP